MEIKERLALSYYRTIAVISELHKVYLVQHTETNRIFVKKILDVYNAQVFHDLAASPVIGTPKIYECFEDNGQMTLIEEYISGESLQEKIKQAALTREDIVSYMLDLCDILGRLHGMYPPVIHRDIKPSNICITVYNRVVLMDFNAAKHFDGNESKDTVLLGTEGYAAPEQYGFGSSSPRTDIYACGVLLQEMLESAHVSDILLKAIAEKCTQMDPLKRYDSVKELKQAIGEAAGIFSPPKIQAHAETPTLKPRDFLPPGFRTGTLWKELFAGFTYICLFWACMVTKIEDYASDFSLTGPRLWLERIIIFLIMLTSIGCIFDYMHVQKILPLCRSKKKFVRHIGILLLCTIFAVILTVLMMLIEKTFFHV